MFSVLFCPSPKSHSNFQGPPSSSSTDAVNCTLSGGAPSSGSASAITSSSYSSSLAVPPVFATVVGGVAGVVALVVGADPLGASDPPHPPSTSGSTTAHAHQTTSRIQTSSSSRPRRDRVVAT